jgi:hypothetical protein
VTIRPVNGRSCAGQSASFNSRQGLVGDRGLTGAVPPRELGDIVAQLARSLAADAAVSDYAGTDVRENFAQAPDPGQAGSWLSLRICLSKTVAGA